VERRPDRRKKVGGTWGDRHRKPPKLLPARYRTMKGAALLLEGKEEREGGSVGEVKGGGKEGATITALMEKLLRESRVRREESVKFSGGKY